MCCLCDILTPYIHNAFSQLPFSSLLHYPLPEATPLSVLLPTKSYSLLSCIVTVEYAIEDDNNEEDPYSIIQRDWIEYNITNPNHYPVSYLDWWGCSQTCPYICYIFSGSVPMIQGCVDPS